MNPQQSPTSTIERPEVHNGSQTHLRGRWLFIARAGWIVLTLLVLTLNAISIPRAVTLLQAVCQPGALCISGLTPADLRQLQQLGLSPGFLADYRIGWDVGTTLIYTALAALIFWRRSVDRMALFCAYMLVLFGGATYTGLLDIGLRGSHFRATSTGTRTHQPGLQCGYRDLHTCHRCALPALTPPSPESYRPAFLPPQVRCSSHVGSLQCYPFVMRWI